MGQLLVLLRGDVASSLPALDLESTRCSFTFPRRAADARVTFPVAADAQPVDREVELVTAVQTLLTPAPSILAQLKAYKGCEDKIRQAISAPSKQTDADAWEAVVPSVIKLKTFYDYGVRIEALIPSILDILCASTVQGTDTVDVNKNLESYQATAKSFADIVNFVWEFDEIKMATPAIQNDFSYYRRTLSRLKGNNDVTFKSVPVNDELANRMSLFYAYPGPMLKLVIDTTNTYVSSKGLGEKVTNCLSMLSTVFNQAISSGSLSSPATTLFALRVMVACIVMYDHIHTVGAYKNAQINIKSYVKTIQTSGGAATPTFINALKYSTRTYNHPDTPKAVKAILEGT